MDLDDLEHNTRDGSTWLLSLGPGSPSAGFAGLRERQGTRASRPACRNITSGDHPFDTPRRLRIEITRTPPPTGHRRRPAPDPP